MEYRSWVLEGAVKITEGLEKEEDPVMMEVIRCGVWWFGIGTTHGGAGKGGLLDAAEALSLLADLLERILWRTMSSGS